MHPCHNIIISTKKRSPIGFLLIHIIQNSPCSNALGAVPEATSPSHPPMTMCPFQDPPPHLISPPLWKHPPAPLL